MRQFLTILLTASILVFTSCKSTSKSTNKESLEEVINERERTTMSLLNRIQRIRGVIIHNGTPSFGKGNNSLEGNGEPLYIVDDYAVGNSFSSVNELVDSFSVKKVEGLSGSEASFYGSRAASGVIKITTYQ